MKKYIKKEGITRGEVSISPQTQTSYGTNIWKLPEAEGEEVPSIFKTFQISASVGSTSLVSIHHVPEDKVLDVTAWIESEVLAFADKFDAGENIESQLHTLGYTL